MRQLFPVLTVPEDGAVTYFDLLRVQILQAVRRSLFIFATNDGGEQFLLHQALHLVFGQDVSERRFGGRQVNFVGIGEFES